MSYQLVKVQKPEGLVSSLFASEAELISAFAELGFEHKGAESRASLRPELQGQPKFSGVCGPMWGGYGGAEGQEPVIRYESWEAYEILSS